ncbi:hypothetical protein ACLOJK_031562 [Asimina triloba]
MLSLPRKESFKEKVELLRDSKKIDQEDSREIGKRSQKKEALSQGEFIKLHPERIRDLNDETTSATTTTTTAREVILLETVDSSGLKVMLQPPPILKKNGILKYPLLQTSFKRCGHGLI